MRYAEIKENDIVDCDTGICVSLWVQGCPHHCPDCHNPNQWSFDGGYPYTPEIRDHILDLINKNGIKRNFSVLGGEPLCPENIYGVLQTVKIVRKEFPDIKIFVWTGYRLRELQNQYPTLDFSDIDFIIDGRYEKDKRDITLKMRGSTNQRIIDVKKEMYGE